LQLFPKLFKYYIVGLAI